MIETDKILIEAIKRRCEKHRWFGIDSDELLQDNPASVHNRDTLKSTFLFPPATKDDVAATETQLGFSLPSSLKNLYMFVANGGFGPDLGIIGISRGYSTEDENWQFLSDGSWHLANELGQRLTDIYLYKVQYSDIIAIEDLGPFVSQQTNPVVLPYNKWIQNLLIFCWEDAGCSYAIHAKNGRVYEIRPAAENAYSIKVIAETLTEWFQPWLNDEWESSFSRRMLGIDPFPSMYSNAQSSNGIPVAQLEWESRSNDTMRLDDSTATLLKALYTYMTSLKGAMAFAPVHEDEVEEIETRIGARLPHNLRDMYLYLSNGWYAPGMSIYGMKNGYIDEIGPFGIASLHIKPFTPVRFIQSAEIEKRLQDRQEVYFPNGSGPIERTFLTGWIPLATVYSDTVYYLDCKTSAVFLRVSNLLTFDRVQLVAPTFYEWIESVINH